VLEPIEKDDPLTVACAVSRYRCGQR